VTLGDFIVDIVPIERAATEEGYDRTRHLVAQSADLRTIVVIIGRQPDGHDLTGLGVHAPRCSFRQDWRVRVPCFSTSHSPGPHSFAGAVHQQMHGHVAGSRSRHLQSFGAAASCCVV